MILGLAARSAASFPRQDDDSLPLGNRNTFARLKARENRAADFFERFSYRYRYQLLLFQCPMLDAGHWAPVPLRTLRYSTTYSKVPPDRREDVLCLSSFLAAHCSPSLRFIPEISQHMSTSKSWRTVPIFLIFESCYLIKDTLQ